MSSTPGSPPRVVYHPEAVVEFNAIRDKQARKKVLTIVAILQQTGTAITEPHSKKVKGAEKLHELRPGGGKTLLRPLYAQIGKQLVILCIGPEAEVDPSGFRAAVERAKRRARKDFGVEV